MEKGVVIGSAGTCPELMKAVNRVMSDGFGAVLVHRDGTIEHITKQEIYKIEPLHDLGPHPESYEVLDRGKQNKLPDGGYRGPEISRGKGKNRDRY